MVFERVMRVPPEGGDPREVLALSDTAAKLEADSFTEDVHTVFSVWCRAEAPGRIAISLSGNAQSYDVTADWQRISITAEHPGDILISVGAGITAYFYKAQLEIGTIPTEWKAAPEDTENEIAAARGAAENAQITANAAREDFRRVVRLGVDGLHVGDNESNGEVLIDSESVNVVMSGQRYSKFAANYVQFGNYQLRRSADGGLVFKVREV